MYDTNTQTAFQDVEKRENSVETFGSRQNATFTTLNNLNNLNILHPQPSTLSTFSTLNPLNTQHSHPSTFSTIKRLTNIAHTPFARASQMH